MTSELSVIVPYKDLESLINSKKRLDDLEAKYDQMEQRYSAIQHMFSEVLEKVAEIDRYL